VVAQRLQWHGVDRRGGDRVAALETAASFASERNGASAGECGAYAEERGDKTASWARRPAVLIALERDVGTSWGVWGAATVAEEEEYRAARAATLPASVRGMGVS
jgi:hypothetical protein